MVILTYGGYHERHAMCYFIGKQADVVNSRNIPLRKGDAKEFSPAGRRFL